jgi:hypothetical protein
MKLLALCLLCLAAAAPAADLGTTPPAKPAVTRQAPPPDPAVLRQGGDTIADAVTIPVPYDGTGTTIGYTDDYDEVCPYDGSTSPDVVYRFEWWMGGGNGLYIDMYGSGYDTKIYLYDEELNLVDCNDDWYPDYTSLITLIDAGVYYLVIDGYGGDAGEYHLQLHEFYWDAVECPGGDVQLEGEPPLAVDYVDAFNGGCNSPDQGSPFQFITDDVFCGVSGWYPFEGATNRDTDWFLLTLPASGTLEITGDGAFETYLFELGPQDCGEVGVLQSLEVGPLQEGTMFVTGEPGGTVWFWVGPTVFTPPGGYDVYEYEYVLWIPDVVATEQRSWSRVKALFD